MRSLVTGCPKKRKEFLGKEFDTITSGKCVIVEYINSTNVTVLFRNPEVEVKCRMGHLRSGYVRNPLIPFVCNKGFVGLGKFDPAIDKCAYVLWRTMLQRVYSEKHLTRKPSYLYVTVCDEWYNFQNFAGWCETQKFFNAKDDNGKTYQLDKDILAKDSKVYSPETCCFVPSEINNQFVLRQKARGKYPIGVSYNKSRNKFESQITRYGKGTTLGMFGTPEEAFYCYKEAREGYIKEVAEKWKDRIDERVYQVLLNYEVRIDD